MIEAPGRGLRALLLGLLAFQATPAATDIDLPHLQPTACWFEPPAGRSATCARLSVPQRRGQDEGKVVLPLVVFHSSAERRQPDPVVVLGGGGPGNAVGIESERVNDWWSFLDMLALDGGRDVIVLDQRGAGLSEPRLDCDWTDYDAAAELAAPVPLAQHLREMEQALRRCRSELAAAGIDISAWDAAASAADLEDLRQMLAIERWNLYGTSYAARIALALLRNHSAGVRSAILDSPVTPEVRFYEDSPAAVDRVFEAVFAACEADADCATAYPGTRLVFARLLRELQRRPLHMEVAWPGSLEPFRMRVDAERLVEILFQALYSSNGSARLPLVVHSLDRGSTDLLAPLARELIKQHLAGGWSDGLYYAVMCREELPFNDFDVALREAAAYPQYQPFNRRWLLGERAACKAWQATPAAPEVESPVTATTPVLVLAGELDPVTPPAWARAAAARLENAWFLELPGVGHDVIGSDGCATQVAADFLQTPESDPRGAECVGQATGPWFDLDL